jgi:ribA/ribD-fused uncharacterized protein
MPVTQFRDQYAALSNFSQYRVKFEGEFYRTSEHAFQAAKTLDPSQRTMVRLILRASEAKVMGRNLTLRPNWEELKLGVMETILIDKFTRHVQAREILLSTGEEELIEGNTWHDHFWGVCSICDVGGENWLGKLLMKIRKELRDGVAASR